MQSMSDHPVPSCTECSAPVERVFRPVAVHFKGSGFYTTDYGRGRSGGGDSTGDGAKTDKDTAGAKSDSKSDSKGESSKKSGTSESSKKSDSSD
jgi:predicted nucleic acid-binding Zn ribbon protein